MTPPSDWDLFNCSEDWEFRYVSELYEDPDEVRDFLEEKCDDGTINRWTHKELYDFLKKNGFKKI